MNWQKPYNSFEIALLRSPLARIEAHIALRELARRLVNPRLVVDPPAYRSNAVLRGPQHLPIAFDYMEK